MQFLRFKFLKINAVLFFVCAQNKARSEYLCTVIALVNKCLIFLMLTTDAINDIQCIKSEKVRMFYVYTFKTNVSIVKRY